MGLQAIPWFTCVSIRLISSTKVYITIRCLREKERAFSLPVTNPAWASFLDFISSWSIAQHNEMISSRFFALAHHNLKSFVEISGIKSRKEHLCCKTLYLTYNSVWAYNWSASLRIIFFVNYIFLYRTDYILIQCIYRRFIPIKISSS